MLKKVLVLFLFGCLHNCSNDEFVKINIVDKQGNELYNFYGRIKCYSYTESENDLLINIRFCKSIRNKLVKKNLAHCNIYVFDNKKLLFNLKIIDITQSLHEFLPNTISDSGGLILFNDSTLNIHCEPDKLPSHYEAELVEEGINELMEEGIKMREQIRKYLKENHTLCSD